MIDISNIIFWHWWVFAVGLMILEVLTPTNFFIWMALSAGAVGLIAFFFPALPFTGAALIFSVLTIAFVVGARIYLKNRPIDTDRPQLNRRSAQYIGRTFTLKDPIVDGFGKVKVDDTHWKISGPDLKSGTKIKVVSVQGSVLEVEKAD